MPEGSQDLQREPPKHHQSKVRVHLGGLCSERLRTLHLKNTARASAIEMVKITITYCAGYCSKEFALNPHKYGRDQIHFFFQLDSLTPFPSLPCSWSSHVTGSRYGGVCIASGPRTIIPPLPPPSLFPNYLSLPSS